MLNSELFLSLYPAFKQAEGVSLPWKISYMLSRNQPIIEAAAKAIEKTRQELISGLTDAEDPAKAQKEAQTQLDELFAMEAGVTPVYVLPQADVEAIFERHAEGLEKAGKVFEITPAVASAVAWCVKQ